MKRHTGIIIATFVLSIITIIATIFIYSPQFAKERGYLVSKVKGLAYKGEVSRLSEGEGALPSPTSTPTFTPKPLGKIIIVLDDFGYENPLIDKLATFSLSINPSIIPFLPHSQDVLKKAIKYGIDPMLHLPMEPVNPSLNPGKDAIYVSLSDEEIKKRTEEAIDSLHGIVGVNNHMGSRATASKRVMKDVIDVIKKHNLFFLDSITTPFSVGYIVAKKEGLPLLKRDIFLDNYKEEEYIKKQLDKLIELSMKKGVAVGIGHANKITIETISQYIPIFEQKKIEIISIKKYVGEIMSK